MPTLNRSLALASIAALPLVFGSAAWAQTDSEPDADAEAPIEAESEAAPGMDTGAETEPPVGASTSTGPKRVRAPESTGAADAEAGAEAGAEPAETGEAAAEEPAQQAGAAAEAEAGAAADEAQAGAAAEGKEELGTGPFVGDYTIGDPEAPVQVIEYASFTCPHCAAFHQSFWDELEEEFVEPGRIGFTLREVYFDRFGLWASMAARCGGEKAFYPMADQYLSKQAEWTKAEDIGLAIAEIARRNGLTEPQLKACLENQDFAKMLVEDYKRNQQEDEVTSTPTFVVRSPDGTTRVVGNKPGELREAIESALPAG